MHKRLVRLLHSGLHPHQVTDLVLQLVVEANQHGDGVVALLDRGAKRCEPGGEARADGRGLEKRNQLLGERRRVGERKSFGIRLDEKVEGINDRHVGGQTDEHVEFVGAFGKDQARDPIAVWILLPVQKVPGRLDRERVAKDRRAALRCGPQPYLMRTEVDQTVEPVGRAVLERDADGH